MEISPREVKDLWQSPHVVALHRSYLVWGVLGLAAPAAIGVATGGALGALTGLLWGGLARVFFVSHVVWSVNSIGHAWGGRARLPHSGHARNNPWLALPALGGGLHANHHDAPRAFTTRVRWWHIDAGGAIVWLFAKVGLTRDLK
jgi:stearoyl-CoA desaturase (delta-9 desaturase)